MWNLFFITNPAWYVLNLSSHVNGWHLWRRARRLMCRAKFVLRAKAVGSHLLHWHLMQGFTILLSSSNLNIFPSGPELVVIGSRWQGRQHTLLEYFLFLFLGNFLLLFSDRTSMVLWHFRVSSQHFFSSTTYQELILHHHLECLIPTSFGIPFSSGTVQTHNCSDTW